MQPPESRLNPPGRRFGPFRNRAMRVVGALGLTAALSACNTLVLKPSGDVAQQQGDLVVVATLLMLLIVVPVMLAVVIFAWRYRANNKDAKYEPDWDHSTQLELMIWAAPLLIIICLGAVTWTSTHLLDPYRTIGRIDAQTQVSQDAKPLEVEVVALDWKWLFIYPEQGVATVNELVVPSGRPLNFKITSANVMNSFYVPAMAGQIYAMPGMETRLHAVMNSNVESVGFSANYSGAGFTHMRFKMRSVSDADFAKWVGDVKTTGTRPQPAGDVIAAESFTGVPAKQMGGTLDRAAYLELEKPTQKVPAIRFANVDPKLYDAVVNMCVQPGKMCMSEMMALDARGGLGKAGIRNVQMLSYDKDGRDSAVAESANPTDAVKRELAWVRALCEQMPGQVRDGSVKAPSDLRSLNGAGIPAPQSIGFGGEDAPAASSPKPAHISLNSRN
ncbi:ubiquinol oxidase subunit II [Novosphingobium resinovorum]|uniref:ubiquinol oxidase subunit II n=1 Tax=Novosphingobium TaxID=165696 RepID=UPI001B3C7D55|nr:MULTISPECIES: ubiquinol oxidase subunit II [Novosphingobium]MBF7012991.1 ubiquinol oxidase subunit II [Novosphingobium sp. HR1a]WJM27727.1 ubiquinol oxidase subunit II [Novosphingobium resinovorum]